MFSYNTVVYNDTSTLTSIYLAETERKLAGVLMPVFDTARRISLPHYYLLDTQRRTGRFFAYPSDTIRILNKLFDFPSDTLRRNGLIYLRPSDTVRKIVALHLRDADTLRELAPTLLVIDENVIQPLGWYVSGGVLPKLTIRDYSEHIPEHNGEMDYGYDMDVQNFTLTLVSPHTRNKEKLRRDLMYIFQSSWGIRDFVINNTTYKFRLDGRIQVQSLPHYIVAEVPLVCWEEV